MLMDVPVSVARAAGVLRMSDKTLRGRAHPVSRLITGQAHVSKSWLNELIQGAARNFDAPPTIDDLLSGRVRLLLPDEARGRLGLSNYGVLNLVSTNMLPALKLSAALMRYCADGVARLEMPPGYITVKMTGHILGLSRYTLDELHRTGLLRLEHSAVDWHRMIVRMDDVRALLRTMLPDWISVDEWIETRQTTDEPLLSPPEAMRRLGVSRQRLAELLRDKWIEYCNSPGGHRMISPTSLVEYETTDLPVGDQQLMRVLGAQTPEALRQWRRRGWLDCPRHVHTHNEPLRRSCVVAIVKPLLSHDISALEWFATRQSGSLYSATEAAAYLGISVNAVNRLALSARLKGIRSPSGRWAFALAQLQSYKANDRAG